MTSAASHRDRSRAGTIALSASVLAFSGFVLNVLYGKFAPVFGWDPGLRLARVPEFLLLFSSAILFVIAALSAERKAGADPPESKPLEEDSHHEDKQGSS